MALAHRVNENRPLYPETVSVRGPLLVGGSAHTEVVAEYVEHLALPELGVLWIRESGTGQRKMLDVRSYDLRVR